MTPQKGRQLKMWSQKLHIYLGLYFLVFLWLFAASGLLLNHGWSFAEFWPQRRQTSYERPISPPKSATDLGRAQELSQQLGLVGELEWTMTRPTVERLDFRVARPGRVVDVKVDFAKQTAAIQEIRVNGWGIFRTLHTFNGLAGQRGERDWILTKLWSFSMDALAAGLIVLILTSLILAYFRREKWRGASIALGLGVVICGFFVFGLNWL
jgi:hypothetical protein